MKTRILLVCLLASTGLRLAAAPKTSTPPPDTFSFSRPPVVREVSRLGDTVIFSWQTWINNRSAATLTGRVVIRLLTADGTLIGEFPGERFVLGPGSAEVSATGTARLRAAAWDTMRKYDLHVHLDDTAQPAPPRETR